MRRATKNELQPPGVRVAAHHQQVIISLLDLLPEQFLFLGGADRQNVRSDRDSVIGQMRCKALNIDIAGLDGGTGDRHNLHRLGAAQQRQGVMDCPDGLPAAVPGDGDPREPAWQHSGGHDQYWATALQNERVGDR